MAIKKFFEFEINTKKAQTNVEDLTAVIEEQLEITREFQRELNELEKQLRDTPKSSIVEQSRLKKRIEGLKDAIKDQRLSTQELRAEQRKSNKTDKEAIKTKKKLGGEMGLLNKLTGGAAGTFKTFIVGIKSTIKSMNLLKLAIISTGIGALLVAVVSLKQAFTRSEEGQNKFAKIMGVIGAAVNVVLDGLSSMGDFIIDVFSGEGEAVKSLKEFGKKLWDVVGLPIKQIITTVKTLAKTIGLLVKGDFTEAFDALKQGGVESMQNIADAGMVIVDAVVAAKDAVIDLTAEIIKEGLIAADIADKRAKADIIDRKLLVERAKANREIAELREEAEKKDKLSVEQRVKLIREAARIEEEITNKEIAAAALRRDALIAENALGETNKTALDAEAAAKAKVFELETKRLNLQKALTSRVQEFLKEQKVIDDAKIAAEQKEIARLEKEEKDAIDKAIKAETNRQEAIDEIREEFRLKRQDINALNEEEKIQLELERSLAELEALEASEAEKAEVIAFYEDKTLKNKEKVLEDEAKIESAKKVMTAQAVANLSGTLANIGALFGKGTAIAKTTALADIAIGTAKGFIQGLDIAQKTASGSTGPVAAFTMPVFYAAQIASVLGAASRAKGILSTVPGGGGGGSISAPSIPQPSATAQAPQFNVVGDTSTNQITDAINSQNNVVKAFVVSSDVTTAQELDRNIIGQASL